MELTIDPTEGNPRLLIDGLPADGVRLQWLFGTLIADVKDGEGATIIRNVPARELPAAITRLTFYEPLPPVRALQSLEVDRRDSRVEFVFGFAVEDWKGGWSFAEYADAFLAATEGRADSVTWVQSDPNSLAEGFEIHCTNVDVARPLNEVIDSSLRILEGLGDDARKLLDAKSGGVLIHFEFPEAVRPACEQYLIYFAQFLADVGVSVTTEISHEAGATLFSVTPDDREEALAAVRDALGVYLQLPASPIRAEMDDLASQRLLANIHHLKGQLTLARAVLQAQHATIEAQQVTIQQLESAEIISAAVRRSDREELLGGTVAITRYEGKGFEINLPEVLRAVKKLFRR